MSTIANDVVLYHHLHEDELYYHQQEERKEHQHHYLTYYNLCEDRKGDCCFVDKKAVHQLPCIYEAPQANTLCDFQDACGNTLHPPFDALYDLQEDIGGNQIDLFDSKVRGIIKGKGKDNFNLVCGYRFSPTDYELISYYLLPKIMAVQLPLDIIREIDVYEYDPPHLPINEFKYTLPGEAYFFTCRVRKYSNRSLTKRTTGNGYWKATGKEAKVCHGNKCVGYKKTMVFYWGKAPTGKRTDWVMDELRVDASLVPSVNQNEVLNSKVENYVVCRIRNKKARNWETQAYGTFGGSNF